MLKLPKGLKKKKKGKKSKHKEQELFTEEELEQYKREHQAQAQAHNQETENSEGGEQGKSTTENDEWSKFKALTAGVDSILDKTQKDLGRIKETSYFQRIPAGVKPGDPVHQKAVTSKDQGWIGFDENAAKQQQEEVVEAPATEEGAAGLTVPEDQFESESEYEDDAEDIFDTSYVDVVASGEVKLAYIPDSPVDDLNDGPDPFDTSYADRIIKGPEVSKRGKKLVSIGSAVEVLTGRVENVQSCVKRVKRRGPQDLLLQSFDDNGNVEVNSSPPILEAPSISKSLLDDDVDIAEDIPIDLSVSLLPPTPSPTPIPESFDNSVENDVLAEFDAVKNNYDDDDEFAQLAAESLSKPVQDNILASAISQVSDLFETSTEVDADWAAFDQTDNSKKPVRPPPPRPQQGPSKPPQGSYIAQSVSPVDDDLGPDPFDTTFAENILPGKAELKLIESEILGLNEDLDVFDPRADEITKYNNRTRSSVHIHITDPAGERESISGISDDRISESDLTALKPIHRDLLGGSTTDLSQLADSPIAPVEQVTEDYIEYCDPFDTSIVDQAVAPGKTELKFIEQELLGDESTLKHSLSDPDFDPRALEEEPKSILIEQPRKPSRPDILIVNNKSVAFSLPTPSGRPDLLAGEDVIKQSKPLTPYYVRESSLTDEVTSEDPFDTTFVSDLAPGKAELKLLESELITDSSSGLKHSLSDQDFNPREEVETKTQQRRFSDVTGIVNPPASLKFKADLLVVDEEHSCKVLTPAIEEIEPEISYIDPFDTSIACNILPGKAELKLLENELITQTTTLKRNLTDPDFDPRVEQPVQHISSVDQDFLSQPEDNVAIKPLTPQTSVQSNNGGASFYLEEDIDPFDTSIANNLGPGKTELKLLESELINQ